MQFHDNEKLSEMLEVNVNGRKNGATRLTFKGNLERNESEVEEVIKRKMLEIGNYESIVNVIYDDDGFSRVFLVFNKENKIE